MVTLATTFWQIYNYVHALQQPVQLVGHVQCTSWVEVEVYSLFDYHLSIPGRIMSIILQICRVCYPCMYVTQLVSDVWATLAP